MYVLMLNYNYKALDDLIVLGVGGKSSNHLSRPTLGEVRGFVLHVG